MQEDKQENKGPATIDESIKIPIQFGTFASFFSLASGSLDDIIKKEMVYNWLLICSISILIGATLMLFFVTLRFTLSALCHRMCENKDKEKNKYIKSILDWVSKNADPIKEKWPWTFFEDLVPYFFMLIGMTGLVISGILFVSKLL
ncbi:MAG TPA: hypothetical protein VNK25_00255 [Candidatus Nitrosotenuis sp.]|jgi:uncharacterized membrane protein YwzB|nr:hypothetical protein [Candidatus Nitrosotenuis sp.]